MKIKYAAIAAVIGLNLIGANVIKAEFPNHNYSIFAEDPIVKNFNAIASGGPLEVIVTLGDREGIRFEGDAEAISTLIAEVKGTALIIRPKVSWTSWSHKYKDKKITAYVNAKSIGSLTMSGDGSITVKGKLEEESLVVTLSGSGSVNANVNVNQLKTVISGSGIANISGDAETVSATISGSGVLAKKDALKANDVSVKISGSGKVYVHTDGAINALISGSGTVYYTGNADVNEKKMLGSGGVKQL